MCLILSTRSLWVSERQFSEHLQILLARREPEGSVTQASSARTIQSTSAAVGRDRGARCGEPRRSSSAITSSTCSSVRCRSIEVASHFRARGRAKDSELVVAPLEPVKRQLTLPVRSGGFISLNQVVLAP